MSAPLGLDEREEDKDNWDRTAHIWDAQTGRELMVLHGPERSVHSAAFSADGRRVVTTSEDRTARVWDATTGRELFTFRGHTDALRSAAFSPGRRTGADGELGRHGTTLAARSIAGGPGPQAPCADGRRTRPLRTARTSLGEQGAVAQIEKLLLKRPAVPVDNNLRRGETIHATWQDGKHNGRKEAARRRPPRRRADLPHRRLRCRRGPP